MMKLRNMLIAALITLTGCATTASTAATQTISTKSLLDTSSLFTETDLTQTVDTDSAEWFTVSDDTDITITEEGTYVITGTANNVTITVEVGKEDKVHLVLSDANITNTDSAVIYVKSADKVYVTTQQDSSLSVTGAILSDGEYDVDAVIYSRDDLVLNGQASLTISSTDKGVHTTDDLKITGGTYNVTTASVAFRANDSIRIADGTFNINAGSDAFHAENKNDDTVGYIYIQDGTFNLTTVDDAIHATSIVQIDGGDFTISASEAIEGTAIQINNGSLVISASGDGINAGQKSNSYDVVLQINGGNLSITMADGDTDALDSNGDFYLTAGTVSITTNYSAIDYDGEGYFTGGTLIVNGETIEDLSTVANQYQ